jgi:sugar lactone lactonase YvrE
VNRLSGECVLQYCYPQSFPAGHHRQKERDMKPAALTVVLFLILVTMAAWAGGPALKFTVPEHDLFPENIAWDAQTGDFFLGSMSSSRIIRIKADGSRSEFLASTDSGLLSSIGMKADAKRRHLWVCSGRFSLLPDFSSRPAETGVLLFHLDSGRLIRKWTMAQESPYHIFNDLVLDDEGNAYATTTMIGTLYRLSPEKAKMERVHQLQEGQHNNGITIGPQGKYLFIAVDRTISRLELASGKLVELPVPDNGAVGTDGLYYYNGSLISIKPRYRAITRIYLEQDLLTVKGVETLVSDHPQLAYPTTGVLAGDRLVYVATSYADVPRNSESPKQHGDVLIHELPLESN